MFEVLLVSRIISILVCTFLSKSFSTPSVISGEAMGEAYYNKDNIKVQVFFQQSSSNIDPDFRNNGANINRFLTQLDSISAIPGTRIDSLVIISSSSSPEGGTRLNDALSLRRASALESLIKDKFLPKAKFQILSEGEDWKTLAVLLRNSDLKGKEEAIRIVENTPEYIVRNGKIVGGREKAMMELHAGRFWWTMDEQIFPLLRQATLTVFYSSRHDDISAVDLRVSGIPSPRLQCSTTTQTALQPQDWTLSQLQERNESRPQKQTASQDSKKTVGTDFSTSRPVCAIKTNLLFDAASLLNLGVEVPVGKRFSIAADGYFPWWHNRSKDITIQMIAGDIEGRFWFRDRNIREPMTGFFAGVYAGAGYFDFQLGKMTDGKGVRGDLFVTGGISAGYSHSIGKHFRLEYSLGVGYLHCNFREYISVMDTKFGDIKAIPYPWESKRISGVVPTKAAVSLVWMISSSKGGAR